MRCILGKERVLIRKVVYLPQSALATLLMSERHSPPPPPLFNRKVIVKHGCISQA